MTEPNKRRKEKVKLWVFRGSGTGSWTRIHFQSMPVPELPARGLESYRQHPLRHWGLYRKESCGFGD